MNPFWVEDSGHPPATPSVSTANGESDWEGALNKLVAEKSAHVSALGNPVLASVAGKAEPWGKENFLSAYVAKKNNTGTKAIKVIVREKTDDVTDEAYIPPKVEHNGRSYLTDVEEGEVFLLQGSPPPMAWPVQAAPFSGGYSISLQKDNAAGTLGCIVQLQDGRFCILSNNHVIGQGDFATADPQVLVIAPGGLDAGMLNISATVIARQAKLVPLNFGGMVNTVDAAVAHVKQDLVSPKFLGWDGPLDPDYVTDPTEGMLVKKAGRTTGFTAGHILFTTGFIPNMAYGPGPDGQPRFATFRQQLVIEGIGEDFSDYGDSGSLIVEAATNKPVGLLFAGEKTTSGSRTYANPIVDVKQALGIARFVAAF
jgi:hypothetical protein